MQIREQGKQVQLLRNPYDKDAKRSVQKVVGHFDRYDATQPTTEQVESFNLTDAEKAQLEAWLEKRRLEKEATLINVTARYAAQNIDRVTAAVDLIQPDQALLVWEAMDRLRKALRKAGHKRPTPPKTEPDSSTNTASE